MVKSLYDMDQDELLAESKHINKRIMLDKRQPWDERKNAWRKLKKLDNKPLSKEYLAAMKKLYE